MDILLLIVFGLLPAIFTVGFFFLITKTKFKNVNKIWKTIIIGVVFGGLCILSTELGPNYNGIPINTRTAVVVTASFVFGWPAGLIAGFIGSLERGLSLLWNSSRAFTEIACTVATAVAGIVAGLLRKFMFDDKTPTPIAGMLCAFVIETFHMLMVFLTNMGDLAKALNVIENVTMPMILANSIGVFISCLVEGLLLYFYGMEDKLFRTSKKKIATSVQINLIFVAVGCFAVSMLITYFIEDGTTKENSENTIITNINDIGNEVNQKSDTTIISITSILSDDIQRWNMAGLNPFTEDIPLTYDPNSPLNVKCKELCNMMNVAEINLVNSEGYIYATSEQKAWRFDMNSSPQSREFEEYLNGPLHSEDSHAQNYMATGYDASIYRKYGGSRMRDIGGYVQAGYNEDQHYSLLNALIADSTTYRTVGSEGRLMVAMENQKIITDKNKMYVDHYLNEKDLFGFDISIRQQGKIQTDLFAGKKTYYVYERAQGYYIVGTMTDAEVSSALALTLYITGFIEVIVFALLVILAYAFIDSVIVKKINRVNDELNQITDGDLNVVVDVTSHSEFQTLSDDINHTVNRLKEYIDEANKRIDRELYFAKQIQSSSLPAPLEVKPSLDLYSLMDTAKEVGGDFYDFYYIDDDHMVILIADVSGKGIPAAMFMMKSKTLIKSLMLKGLHTDEAFYEANNELCRQNEAEMFVTAWMALIDIRTGDIEYCNAGHNSPLFGTQSKHDFHYFKTRANLVLGGMEGVPYTRGTYRLQENETIFLYTDGVTESTNANKELYGEQRLQDLLNLADGLTNRMIVKSVKQAVDEFAGDVEQFDDITMLAFTFLGKSERYCLNISSNSEEFSKVYDFVNDTLSGKVDERKRKHLLVALDEILSNISNYGYKDEVGPINIVITIQDNEISITVADASPKFNPLEKEDPNVSLSAEEREIGGLGIFMVKQLMDEVHYQNIFGRNLLTMIMKKSETK